jgi:hypothetical protein
MSIKIKSETFERMFPEAQTILFDVETNDLEIDGKKIKIDQVQLETEFNKTKSILEKEDVK